MNSYVKSSYVLGISTMGSSAACLMRDNSIIFAIEEERLSRVKNDDSFPFLSIKAALDFENLSLNDINAVAVYWQPKNFLSRLFYTLLLLIYNFKNFNYFFNFIIGKFIPTKVNKNNSWIDLFQIKKILIKEFGLFNGNIYYFDHHLCHVISSYIVSPKVDCTALVIDGGGEDTSTEQYIIRNHNITRQYSIKWPNSLGHFYSFFTGYLGFKMLEGEYKMMGMASFGTPKYSNLITEKILHLNKKYYNFNFFSASYHLAIKNIFKNKIINYFGPKREIGHIYNQDDFDLASSVQRVYEDTLMHILRSNHNQDKILLLSGGCALNVTANGVIIKEKIYDKVIIPPFPHDAGAAIGAGILAQSKILKCGIDQFNLITPYLGPIYSNSLSLIQRHNLAFEQCLDSEDMCRKVADLIARGNVVAFFQGRSEFGPRALGNRSILADPRNADIQKVINEKVKNRELFRPFAPSCKEEVVGKYFDLDQSSPYMNITANVKQEHQKFLPAITHIDGTARVHTVTKNSNYIYWNLLDEFEKITKYAVLLNTSFNIQEPIVETPNDAVNCFLRSKIDYLIIDNILIKNKNA